jgi:hypothetical protein
MCEFEIDDNPELHSKLEQMPFPCDMALTIETEVRNNRMTPVAVVIDAKLI